MKDRILYIMKIADFQDVIMASMMISFCLRLALIPFLVFSACFAGSAIWFLNFENAHDSFKFVRKIQLSNSRYQLYEFENTKGLILTSLDAVYVELPASESLNSPLSGKLYKPLTGPIEYLQIIDRNDQNDMVSSRLNSLVPGQSLILKKRPLWPTHIANTAESFTLLLASEESISYLLPELEQLYLKKTMRGRTVLIYMVESLEAIGKKFLNKFSEKKPNFIVYYVNNLISGTTKRALAGNWIQGQLVDEHVLSNDLLNSAQEIFIAADDNVVQSIKIRLDHLEKSDPPKVYVVGVQ